MAKIEQEKEWYVIIDGADCNDTQDPQKGLIGPKVIREADMIRLNIWVGDHCYVRSGLIRSHDQYPMPLATEKVFDSLKLLYKASLTSDAKDLVKCWESIHEARQLLQNKNQPLIKEEIRQAIENIDAHDVPGYDWRLKCYVNMCNAISYSLDVINKDEFVRFKRNFKYPTI